MFPKPQQFVACMQNHQLSQIWISSSTNGSEQEKDNLANYHHVQIAYIPVHSMLIIKLLYGTEAWINIPMYEALREARVG